MDLPPEGQANIMEAKEVIEFFIYIFLKCFYYFIIKNTQLFQENIKETNIIEEVFFYNKIQYNGFRRNW